MGDGDRLPDGADRVPNEAAANGGTVVPSRRWYRDPVLLVPAAVTIVAAIIALVPYFFPQQQPDGQGTGKYVDPEKCLTVGWPGPGTVEPQQVRANTDVAGYAILRQKPCWRALKPQPSTRFDPASGISVLCWVNADDVIDTSKVSRYGWYLVADPAHPGQTIGWTPQWPYEAPEQDVPTCGQHAQGSLSPVTLVAAALACVTAIFLIILAIRRRRRDLPQPAGPPAFDNEQP
ncbi:hypothetical protein ACFWIY_23600 [Streptomyces sioyaensis]|uniref:hypothetical protein n=1 Tax=Streptomyces sioyaensis TaxID=67364 RepID=UPI00364A264D